MERPDRTAQIMRFARWLSATFLILALLHPVIVLATTTAMSDAQLATPVLGPLPGDWALSAGQRAMVLCLAVLPALILSTGLIALRPALAEMRSGAAFAGAAFRGLRRFAAAIVAAAITKIVIVPLIGLLLTWSHEQRSLVLSIGFEQVQALVLGAAIWLLAWIMAEGHDLATENAQFV